MSDQHPSVVNETAEHRFAIHDPDGEAFIEYRLNNKRLVLVHTEVPPELGGRGLAADLVLAAVDHAEANGLTIVPVCPMARGWLVRHADVAARVTVDWAQAADD